MPGDQTTIHDDRVYSRVLAFIWHLTRDWQASWGGNFVWCTTGEVLPLAFNALHLMAVSLFGWHRAVLDWSGAEAMLLSSARSPRT